MEFENLKVGDLIMETRNADWAVWELKEKIVNTFSCQLVACQSNGWTELFVLYERSYNITDYIGKIDDFPELLL